MSFLLTGTDHPAVVLPIRHLCIAHLNTIRRFDSQRSSTFRIPQAERAQKIRGVCDRRPPLDDLSNAMIVTMMMMVTTWKACFVFVSDTHNRLHIAVEPCSAVCITTNHGSHTEKFKVKIVQRAVMVFCMRG